MLGLGGLSAYVLYHRQSEHMKICTQNMKALESLLRNVPQNEEGENKSQAIGRAVSLLEQWRSESWFHQAFNAPPWTYDFSDDSSSSSSEDDENDEDDENENGDDDVTTPVSGDAPQNGEENDDSSSSETF